MKKNIFLLLTSTLFILMLMYFYERREIILNKEILLNENTYIEYPYFNKKEIDNYITTYLNSYTKKQNDYLFIDYDYINESNRLNLIFYIYEENGILVRETSKNINVNLEEDKVKIDTSISKEKKEYDYIQNKMIDINKPMIALTFDDGPNHNTSKILNILEKYNIKATFFILGTNIKGNEKIIKRMDNLNMEIGNHMFSHKLLTKLKNEEIKNEIKKVDDSIFNIINHYPTLVRPSYGTYNKRIQSLIDRPIIIWNIDTLDWKYHSSKNIYKRVMKDISDGDIILMHDIYSATANSLELIIPELLKDGYQFTTVSELLYYKNIKIEKGRVYSRAN